MNMWWRTSGLQMLKHHAFKCLVDHLPPLLFRIIRDFLTTFKSFKYSHSLKEPKNIVLLKDLIRGLKNDEIVAFERLYNLYSVKVFNFSRKYLKSDEDAQEIVQDVFMKIWDSRHQIDLEQYFNGFIFRISKNAALNKIRKRVGEPDSFWPVKEDFSAINLTEQEILFAEMKDLLEKAVEGLPPKRQEIFKLSRFHGLSNKEIAARLDISINTVEGQIRKAIKYLRSYMEWVSLELIVILFLG